MNDNLFGLTKEDIFNICINNEFPGSSRWEPENPIWDSFLPGYKSPKDAWKDEKLLMDGIKNMFWILEKSIRENKYENFVERHKKAFDMAKEGNISMLTSLVLTRFTVAKIAPKVTALSPTTWIKIINDSGIDLGKYAGIYCPMAGFGGIIEGAKRWYDEKGESYEGKIESYDINKSFVDYYHWDGVRDMLAQKIETDKVCIVCPPFGKEYEHWKGTPDEMSDITYLEWHHLVHEYVKAPEYIIMGPELKENSKDLDTKGKKFNGLFRKRVGVQLWTDELWKKVCDMTPTERKKEGLKF